MRSIDDIINKEFHRSFMGYDMQQVDLFLDEIIERFERLESERQEMLTAMEYLLNKLDEANNLPSGSSRKALTSHQRKLPLRVRAPKQDIDAPDAEAELEEVLAVAIEYETYESAPEADPPKEKPAAAEKLQNDR